MIRVTIFLVTSLGILSPADAGLILTTENVPAEYTPGTPFSFDVRLQDATKLNAFFIDLTLSADSGTAGIDFFFDDALTDVPASQYVFGDSGVNPDGFFAFAGVDGNTAVISLSDLLDIGEEVSTAPGVNELVANVVVQTSSNVGNLSIEFDPIFLELTDDFGDPIPGFASIDLATPSPVQPQTSNVIPEPGSLSIWIIAGAACGCYRRRRREA